MSANWTGTGTSNRVQSRKPQARRLLESAHDVHGMHGLAGGAFHEVVDGGNHDEPVSFHFEPDIAVIGACKEFGFRMGMVKRLQVAR